MLGSHPAIPAQGTNLPAVNTGLLTPQGSHSSCPGDVGQFPPALFLRCSLLKQLEMTRCDILHAAMHSRPVFLLQEQYVPRNYHTILQGIDLLKQLHSNHISALHSWKSAWRISAWAFQADTAALCSRRVWFKQDALMPHMRQG